MTKQIIFKNGCWNCLRAVEDPQEKYVCPKLEQHLVEYKKWRGDE